MMLNKADIWKISLPDREISITLPRKRSFKFIRQFRITLYDVESAIWRRIQVPDYYSFYELHIAIQDAMGWWDSHLHAFEIKWGRKLNEGLRIECPFTIEDIPDKDPIFTTEVPVSKFIGNPGDRCLYEYDFGDGWEHEIVFEGIFPRMPDMKYPRCLEGERACPPEDCGGVPGYERCLKALDKDDNSEGLLEWLGDWDPERFDPGRIKFQNPRKRLIFTLKD